MYTDTTDQPARVMALRAKAHKPTRRDWELRILAEATHFVVSTPVQEHRAPGQPMRWSKATFTSGPDRGHSAACAYARALRATHGQHARCLVYAVTADDRSFPLSEGDWT